MKTLLFLSIIINRTMECASLLKKSMIWSIKEKLSSSSMKSKRLLRRVRGSSLQEEVPQISDDSSKQTNYMSIGMESYLCHKIKEFEKQRKYLDKSISLSNLSASLGVNHRYVSYYINMYKEKDFATYINELRISYMVDTLISKPHYLTYKISYLADKSGFASHSRFTINFKKYTGVLPSEYISELKQKKAMEGCNI